MFSRSKGKNKITLLELAAKYPQRKRKPTALPPGGEIWTAKQQRELEEQEILEEGQTLKKYRPALEGTFMSQLSSMRPTETTEDEGEEEGKEEGEGEGEEEEGGRGRGRGRKRVKARATGE